MSCVWWRKMAEIELPSWLATMTTKSVVLFALQNSFLPTRFKKQLLTAWAKQNNVTVSGDDYKAVNAP